MENKNISKNLSENLKYIKETFSDFYDLVVRDISVGDILCQKFAAVYIDGICDKDFISESVVARLLDMPFKQRVAFAFLKDIDFLSEKVISSAQTTVGKKFSELVAAVNFGDMVLLAEGKSEFLVVSSKKAAKRAISTPESKRNVRGPKDAFNENLKDNTSLLRCKLQSENLKMISSEMGSVSKTHIVVCYIDGIVNKELLNNALESLSHMKFKSVLGAGFLQNEIENKNKAFFDYTEATERPDDVCRALLQGRVAVMVDNTPFVMIIPALFKSMISGSDDFYESDIKRRLVFYLRIISIAFTVMLPALYIAVVDHNQEFISTKLISFIMFSREKVPFSAFVEIFMVEIIFELILEAGLRLPNQLAFTVSMVGSIVIGQALVDASLVNITVCIIVALTAVLTFVIPGYSLSVCVRILKFVFMFAALLGGFFGMLVAFLVTLCAMCDMNAFGVEFMYPFADSEITLKSVQKEEK